MSTMIETVYGKALSHQGQEVFDRLMSSVDLPVKFCREAGPARQRMQIQEGKVTITITDKTPDKLFEETLLHELYHVYQFSCGYPDLKTSEKDDSLFEKCTTIVSSMICDQDVYRFLREHKITLHKDTAAAQYQARKTQLEYWSSPNFAPKVMQTESLMFASVFVNLHFTYNKQKAKYLVDVMDRFDSNIRNYTNVLLDITENGDVSTPQGCREIYQRCIEAFPFMSWYISDTSSQSF